MNHFVSNNSAFAPKKDYKSAYVNLVVTTDDSVWHITDMSLESWLLTNYLVKSPDIKPAGQMAEVLERRLHRDTATSVLFSHSILYANDCILYKGKPIAVRVGTEKDYEHNTVAIPGYYETRELEQALFDFFVDLAKGEDKEAPAEEGTLEACIEEAQQEDFKHDYQLGNGCFMVTLNKARQNVVLRVDTASRIFKLVGGKAFTDYFNN